MIKGSSLKDPKEEISLDVNEKLTVSVLRSLVAVRVFCFLYA